MPQYFLLPQNLLAETVFAAVCVSLLESRVISGSGERSSRYKQSRYDQRSEREREGGGETTDCEAGTYFTHSVVICQALAPNYSDYSDVLSISGDAG